MKFRGGTSIACFTISRYCPQKRGSGFRIQITSINRNKIMIKFIRIISVLFIFITLLSCAVMPIHADDEVETREVMVSIFVQNDASVAKNEMVDIYFRNTSTDEEYKFTLKGNNTPFPVSLPKGEYSVVKATLSGRPEVEFQTSTAKLTVDDSENIFFTISLKKVLVSEENKDDVENSINEFEKEKINDAIAGVITLLWVAWLIVVVVYLIKGRFCKLPKKAEFIKAKGKLITHLFFTATFSLLFGLFFASINGETFSVFGGIFGLGIPVGAVLVAPIALALNNEEKMACVEDMTQEQKQEISASRIALFCVLTLLAALVGLVVLPIVVTIDIMRIVKTYREYTLGDQ